MRKIGFVHPVHRVHLPGGHVVMMRMEHLMHDPRFWAILSLFLVTALVLTLAILTQPEGAIAPESFIPGPFIY